MYKKKNNINEIKSKYLPGMKVLLYEMVGENLPTGLKGTIKNIDDIGQIHVDWENGSTLPLNLDLDKFAII